MPAAADRFGDKDRTSRLIDVPAGGLCRVASVISPSSVSTIGSPVSVVPLTAPESTGPPGCGATDCAALPRVSTGTRRAPPGRSANSGCAGSSTEGAAADSAEGGAASLGDAALGLVSAADFSAPAGTCVGVAVLGCGAVAV